jgi:RNA polymerase sigma-70 factor (ECF subfamily)
MPPVEPISPETILAHAGGIHRLARALTREAEFADDVVQQTLTAALERPPMNGQALGPWLARVARNWIANARRTYQRRARIELEAARSHALPSTHELVVRAEMQRELMAVVLALEARQRDVILLRYLENLAPREIAARLGVPVRTVHTRLARGLARLREELRRDGGRERWLDACLLLGGSARDPLSLGMLAMKSKVVGAAVLVLVAAYFGVHALVRTEKDRALTPIGAGTHAPEQPVSAPEAAASSRTTAPALAAGDSPSTIDPGRVVTVAVVMASGSPVPSARVVIFRDKEVIASESTNADGQAQFQSGVGSAQVAILAAGWPITSQSILLDPGRREVTLPDGALLGGRALVDGAAPAEPIGIHFEPDKLSAALPANVIAKLKPVLPQTTQRMASDLLGSLFTTTDASGAFVFRGLLPDESGVLTWDGPYVLDRGDKSDLIWDINSLKIGAPRTAISLSLTRGVELSFRVVDPTGAPVPEARVDLFILVDGENQDSTSMIRGAADSLGRYRTVIGRTPPTELGVGLARPSGADSTRHKLVCPAQTLGTWDAGDLALAASRALSVHVQDDSKAPIQGAAGLPLPSNAVTNERSDADGNFVLGMRDNDRQILVQSVGYESAILDVPSDAKAIAATLPKVSLLECSIPENDDVDRRTLQVTVTGDPPMFIDDMSQKLPLLQDYGSSASRERDERGTSSYTTSVGSKGRFRIAGLAPGVSLKVQLSATTGPVLSQVFIAPLTPGEHRTIQFVLRRRPRALVVHVEDPDGAPVPAARVTLQDDAHGKSARAIEQAPGTYKLASIFADIFALRVEADGFPTKYVRGVSISPEALTIKLDRPQDLEIELVNPDGSIVSGAAEVTAGESWLAMKSGKKTAPGHWLVRDLPSSEILIHASGEFGSADCIHDMSVHSRRLVVGQKGSVIAHATIPDEQKEREWSFSICAEGGAKAQARQSMSNGKFQGLAFGAYDVWLEGRSSESPWAWVRAGSAVRAVLTPEQPSSEIELHP